MNRLCDLTIHGRFLYHLGFRKYNRKSREYQYRLYLIFQSTQWNECLLNLLANKDFEVILRGAVIVDNMCSTDKETAERVLETEIMEVLQAHIFRAKRKLWLKIEATFEQQEELCYPPNDHAASGW